MTNVYSMKTRLSLVVAQIIQNIPIENLQEKSREAGAGGKTNKKASLSKGTGELKQSEVSNKWENITEK